MRIIQRSQNEIRINLLAVVSLLIRNIALLIFSALLYASVFFGVSRFVIQPTYAATITLCVTNSANANATTTISQGDLAASARLVDTYAALISSKTMLKKVIAQTNVNCSVAEIRQKISTSSINNTEVFNITIRDHNPQTAADIANAIADFVPEQTASFIEGSSAKVVDRADVPTAPVSPNLSKNTVQGAVFGLLLSMLLLVLNELLDTTIKSESDMDEWDIPHLGSVPELSTLRRDGYYGYAYGYDRFYSSSLAQEKGGKQK